MMAFYFCAKKHSNWLSLLLKRLLLFFYFTKNLSGQFKIQRLVPSDFERKSLYSKEPRGWSDDILNTLIKLVFTEALQCSLRLLN